MKSKRPLFWNKDNIKEAILEYQKLNGKLPTARDFDITDYLPTARLIQRNFGGLEEFRSAIDLGGQTNYTKGKYRSDAAKKIIKNSYQIEEDLYYFLVKNFSEISVHEQKRLRPGNIASDFYIYTSAGKGFAVDVFQAKDLYTLKSILNIKLKRYQQIISYNVYFVVAGKFKQTEINQLMGNKKVIWPNNVIVMTQDMFKSNIKTLV